MCQVLPVLTHVKFSGPLVRWVQGLCKNETYLVKGGNPLYGTRFRRLEIRLRQPLVTKLRAIPKTFRSAELRHPWGPHGAPRTAGAAAPRRGSAAAARPAAHGGHGAQCLQGTCLRLSARTLFALRSVRLRSARAASLPPARPGRLWPRFAPASVGWVTPCPGASARTPWPKCRGRRLGILGSPNASFSSRLSPGFITIPPLNAAILSDFLHSRLLLVRSRAWRAPSLRCDRFELIPSG